MFLLTGITWAVGITLMTFVSSTIFRWAVIGICSVISLCPVGLDYLLRREVGTREELLQVKELDRGVFQTPPVRGSKSDRDALRPIESNAIPEADPLWDRELDG
jgi:hypothetical protein